MLPISSLLSLSVIDTSFSLSTDLNTFESCNILLVKECEFVKAYLALQKYRFGERLNYNIDIEADCMECQVPKLTLVTFVENACVHGIESKARQHDKKLQQDGKPHK